MVGEHQHGQGAATILHHCLEEQTVMGTVVKLDHAMKTHVQVSINKNFQMRAFQQPKRTFNVYKQVEKIFRK